jgi:hypothetical protein
MYRSRRHVLLIVTVVVISTSGCARDASPTQTADPRNVSTTAPRVIVNRPISGSGNLLSTSVMFHDDAGQMNITDVFLLINDPTRGVDGTGGCVAWYQRLTGDVYLLDDGGKSWLGPHKAGSKTTLVNSQCLISMRNSGLVEVNGDLQWVTAVGFSPRFSGPRHIYAKALNRQKQESNFELLGAWSVN